MIVLKLLFYFLVVIASLSLFIIYANSHPPRLPLSPPPLAFGLKFEEIAFRTDDGIPIKGWFVRSPIKEGPAPAVILCHGLGSNRSDFSHLAGYLAREGFHILLFDFRAHGKSGGRRSSFGHLEKDDLKAAIQYLRSIKEVEAERIGVYGFSMGAAVAILTAAGDQRIKAVVADSSFTNLKEQGQSLLRSAYGSPFTPLVYPLIWTFHLYFGIDPELISPLKEIKKISPRPVLIVGGAEDEQMPASDAKRLYSAAGEPKDLWLVPGAIHGGTIYSAGDLYYKRVTSFFLKYLQRVEAEVATSGQGTGNDKASERNYFD